MTKTNKMNENKGIIYWPAMIGFILLLAVAIIVGTYALTSYNADVNECESQYNEGDCGLHKCLSEIRPDSDAARTEVLRYQNCLMENLI